MIAFTLVRGGPMHREPGIASLVLFLLMTWYGIYWIQRAFQREPKRDFTAASKRLSSRRSPWVLLVYPVLGLCLLMVGSQGMGIGFVSSVPVIIACTAIHEVSHALAAMLLGGRVHGIEFWPIKLERGPSGWRMSRRLNLGGITRATGPVIQQRIRRMVFVMAGPLADLLLVVSGIALVQLTTTASPVIGSAGRAFGCVVAGIGTMHLVSDLNIRGKTPDGIATDGAQLYSLWRIPLSLRAIDLRLLHDAFSGKHPAQWSLTTDEYRSLLLPPRIDEGFTLSIVSSAAFDLERFDLLSELLRYDRSGISNNSQAGLYLNEACLVALRSGDCTRARALLEAGAPLCSDANYPLLAEAAILAAESNLSVARAKCEQWRSDTARSPSPGLRELGNRWVLAELSRRFEVPASEPESVTA